MAKGDADHIWHTGALMLGVTLMLGVLTVGRDITTGRPASRGDPSETNVTHKVQM